MAKTAIERAEDLASKQREISVAEFFEKNRHLLGFDNPAKSLLTVVKEAVDNSVEWHEPVVIKYKGKVQLVRIGEFIDKHIKITTSRTGVESSEIKNCEVLVYDEKDFKMKFKPASKVHRHVLRDKLFEIETVGGRKVTVTGSHSVFVLKGGKVISYPVRDMKVGDFVAVPRKGLEVGSIGGYLDLREDIKELPKSIRNRLVVRGVANNFEDVSRDWKRFDYIPYSYFEVNHIEVPRNARIGVRNGRGSIPVIIPANSEFARLLGYYAAEGTCYGKLLTFSFGAHEKEIIEDTERCLKNVFGDKINFSRVWAHSTAITIKVYSEIMAILFKHIFQCGSKADKKRVPWIILNFKKSLQKEFLKGYIAGDGYIRKGKITVATVSEGLSIGLQYILALNGIAYSVRKTGIGEKVFPGGRTSKCRAVYYLYIYGETLEEKQRNSPLSQIPLQESGLRDIIRELNPLISYHNPHYRLYKTYKNFTIESAIGDIEQAISYKRNKIGLKLGSCIEYMKNLLHGDIGFLQVKVIREVQSDKPYVYDFSVPGDEKFLGGRGPIFLHNSLDACEEARILPELKVTVKEPRQVFRVLDGSNVEIGRLTKRGEKTELVIGDKKADFVEKKEPSKKETVYLFKDSEGNNYKFRIRLKKPRGKEEYEEVYEFVRGRTPFRISKLPSDRFLVRVEDNGPGIVKAQVPRIFGKLLYGSRFGAGKQSRGAQGIGISAALLYSQLTTGKSARVWSRISPKKPVNYMELRIDTTKNEPVIVEEKSLKDGFRDHGVSVEFEIEGKWIKKRHSVSEYLKEAAAVNPYAKITYEAPDGQVVVYPRVVKELPKTPKAIKPHPHGVEMGMLDRMLKLTDSRSIEGFLMNEFCRIGSETAKEVRKLANLKPNLKPKQLDHNQVERLWRTMQAYPFMKPPTNCLSPIGEETFKEGIKKVYKPDFVTSVTRPATVYRGNPFQIEIVIGYGGDLPKGRAAKLLRFANRVPLLYQASSCAITKAVHKVDWKHYNLEQEGGIPVGPVVIAVHMASVWIPYVSEAKEAIDPYPAIMKEMKLALQEAGRRLQRFLAGKRKREEAAQRKSLFEKYIPEAAESLSKLSGTPKGRIVAGLEKMLKRSRALKQEGEKSPEGKGE